MEYIAKVEQVLGLPHSIQPDMVTKEVLNKLVLEQAQMLSYNHVYMLIMFVFLASIPLVFFLKGLKDVKIDE